MNFLYIIDIDEKTKSRNITFPVLNIIYNEKVKLHIQISIDNFDDFLNM